MPKSWVEFKIEWKPKWDETLAANDNEQAWKQELAKDLASKNAVERIVVVRRAWLFEQLIAHFPNDKDNVAAACRRLAETYASLGDLTRSATWLKKLAEDFVDLPARADVYAKILSLAEMPNALPNERDWILFATDGIAAMVKSGALPKNHATAILARKRMLAILLADRNHVAARRWIDVCDAEAKDAQWGLERAALFEGIGHRLLAADLLEAAGDKAKAATLKAAIEAVRIEDIGKPMPRDLEIRWNALNDKRMAAKPILEDLGLVQESLKLAAETDAFWQAGPNQRVQCWFVLDQLLRSLPQAEINPLRQAQETAAKPLVKQLLPTAEAQAVNRLFRIFPWSASVHRLLVESGEVSLRANRADEAYRAFQHVLSHSDDAILMNQAQVGAWYAMTELAEPKDSFEDSLAAIPDATKLSWFDAELPASDVKAILRKLLPASSVASSKAKSTPRIKLEIPAVLAAETPAARERNTAPQGVNALAIRRVEQTDFGFYVFGPRHVACFDPATYAMRWLQIGNNVLETPNAPDFPSSEPIWAADSWRPVTLGSQRATAVGQRRAPQDGEAVAPSAVYSLLFNNLKDGAQFELAAFDTVGGKVLWHTLAFDDWRELEPLSEPVAVEGRVFTVALSLRTDPVANTFLVCLDAETGKTIWKQPLGVVPAQTREQKRALLSSAVTLHRGSIFVSTNMGILARCDARNGAVEWVRSYESANATQPWLEQNRREGSSPLIVGDRVCLTPRDHSGIMVVDRILGNLLWESPLLPSEQMVGATTTSLIVRGMNELAAIDLASGRELWVRSMGDSRGARAVLASSGIHVISDDKLLRLSATTGEVLEETILEMDPASGNMILADGSLAQLKIAPAKTPAPKLEYAAKPNVLPLVEDWVFPCSNSRLVIPPEEEKELSSLFGILADRRFVCVSTKPKIGVAWQTLLRDGVDSIGFHGKLVIAARGAVLTASDAATGATRWTTRLPFEPQVVGGDARTIFAGELSRHAKIVSLDSATGQIVWYRWFGEEAVVGEGALAWISLRTDAAKPPALILHWRKTLFGAEASRPAEMLVDAKSGAIFEMRPFLGTEAIFPERIVFGDCSRTYTGSAPFSLRSYQPNFRRDVIAFADSKNLAHLVSIENSVDLTPGSSQMLDVANDKQYEGSIGFFAAPSGLYVKKLHELSHFDTASKKETAIKIPIGPEMSDQRTVLDLAEKGDSVAIISQEPGQPVKSGGGSLAGLKDSTGKGDVKITWLGPGAQVHNGRLGFPEAYSNPVATLLDGRTKEHYRQQVITMSGLNSLGWQKYDVFLYGSAGNTTISDVKEPQTCTGWDTKNPNHRTTFIRGVNFLKFEGIRGDTFTLTSGESDYSAVQIADATASSAPGRDAASVGINWSGGGLGLGPNDRVGAEVVAGAWYNINADYSLTGGYQNHRVFVDVVERKTGTVQKSQAISVGPRDQRLPNHKREAVIRDDAVIVTDSSRVHVYRSATP